MQQELRLNVPAVPHSPINLQVDEIPLDQLIEPGEEEFHEPKHALAEPFLAGQLLQDQQEANQHIQNQQNEVELMSSWNRTYLMRVQFSRQ